MAGIYIHIPFCKQACYYCDFHFSTSLKKKEELLSALSLELQLRKDEFSGTSVETIYFGGGTPSLLSKDELQKLIDTVYEHYEVSDDPEITLEANPDDLSKAKIKELDQSPVNRLSIGIQSFFDADLKLMNRAHNANEAQQCLSDAASYFDNMSLDLIYGIPGATSEQWQKNIEIALSYNVPHISSYALTVEPQTALATYVKKGIIDDVDDDIAHEQFHMLVDTLVSNNYVHYELSNFGKEGYFSKNNTAYWQGKAYVGIGPSAHSYDGKRRGWNVRNNSKYIQSLAENKLPIEWETLSITDRYNEYIMTGLRTIWGVSLNVIETKFGALYKEYMLKQAKAHLEDDLLNLEGDQLYVTKKGKFLSDGIASQLFKVNL